MSLHLHGHGYSKAPFNDRLIEEVKKYPGLYNQSRRSFMDSKERSRVWDNIAVGIDPAYTGEYAKKRWLQMRDRYRKELKVALRQGIHGAAVKWKYFERLAWLEPHLKDLSKSEEDAMMERLQREGFGQQLPPPRDSSPSPITSSRSNSPLVKTEDLTGDKTSSDDSIGSSPSPLSEDKRDECSEVSLGCPPSAPLAFPFLSPLFAQADWINDDDLLFGRFVAIRLKRMHTTRSKRIRAAVLGLLEESEEDDDTLSAKSGRDGDGSS